MIYPGSLENIIRKMAEAKDEALWKVLYIKCQHCGELRPIKEAVGLELPPENGDPRYEIWCGVRPKLRRSSSSQNDSLRRRR